MTVIDSGYSYFETEDASAFVPMLERMFPGKIEIETDKDTHHTLIMAAPDIAVQAAHYLRAWGQLMHTLGAKKNGYNQSEFLTEEETKAIVDNINARRQ